MTAAPPPHIYTLTGNLLAERTLEFGSWQAGVTQRAQRESFQVGGKGINVSKMLNRLGAANTALCFAGGSSGDACEAWLRERKFAYHAFRTATAARSGCVIRDASGEQRETTFLGLDAPPDADAVGACAGYLDAQPAGQVLALCGSFPGWPEPSFDPLRGALERWLARGVLVADTYGAPLAWAMAQPLELVKLNSDELQAAGIGPTKAFRSPVRNWVVTDGPNPVLVREESGNEFRLTPPPVRETSATGSGDVLLACVLSNRFHRAMTLANAVADALPYAAANAAHPGIAEFPAIA